MNAVLRVLPLATIALLGAYPERVLRAEESLPAIFSDVAPSRATRKLEAPEIVRPHLLLSDRARAALDERLALRAAALPATFGPPTRGWMIDDHGDAIVMNRYVVNVPPEKKVKPERDPNPLYHVFSSGDIWVHDKWGALPQLYWSLGNVLGSSGAPRLPTAGATSTSPRVELRLVWPF